jgi:hypothetical protein
MANKKPKLKSFISEPVSVDFSSPPAHAKKPHCPDRFYWRDEAWHIIACISEWKDFSRRGRMAKNMQPQHAQVASERGSWGVGRFYFDVQAIRERSHTQNSRCFRLYYDRAPEDATERTGQWILLAELTQAEE